MNKSFYRKEYGRDEKRVLFTKGVWVKEEEGSEMSNANSSG